MTESLGASWSGLPVRVLQPHEPGTEVQPPQAGHPHRVLPRPVVLCPTLRRNRSGGGDITTVGSAVANAVSAPDVPELMGYIEGMHADFAQSATLKAWDPLSFCFFFCFAFMSFLSETMFNESGRIVEQEGLAARREVSNSTWTNLANRTSHYQQTHAQSEVPFIGIAVGNRAPGRRSS